MLESKDAGLERATVCELVTITLLKNRLNRIVDL